MLIITILRLVILLTFILLVAEGIVAIIMSRYFYKLYIRRHLELQSRVKALETRMEAGKPDAKLD